MLARDEQLPPEGDWTYWTALAGRGWGKTRTGAEWVNQVAKNNPKTIGHLVAPTAGDLDKVMLNGPSGIITTAPDDFRPYYIGSKNKLIWPNKTVAYTFSAEEPERLRGPQCLAGETKVTMGDGCEKQIADVLAGETVMTRRGARRVLWSGMTNRHANVWQVTFSNGATLLATDNHPVWIDGKGFVDVGELQIGDVACAISAFSDSIVKFTNFTKALFRKGMKFITKTATDSTTRWKIWKPCQYVNIAGIMRPQMGQPSATRKRARYRDFTGHPLSFGNINAQDVGNHSTPERLTPENSAGGRASTNGEAKKVQVVRVEKSVKHIPVYDLTVDDAHEFYANGILVHNCNWFWGDEVAAWKRLQETWDQLQFGYRLVPTLGGLVTTTPRPLPVIKQLVGQWVRDGVAVVTGGSTYDNKANLSDKFFREVVSKYEGTRLGRQELDAAILEDVLGALWNLSAIDETRLASASCDFERIVVAIDPPASSGEKADECGMIVAARGTDKRGYVLADITSHRESPSQWASRAIRAYHEYKADRIIAEVNQGGDMVAAVLRQVDPTVPLTLVHASRGKVTRAEPISALYEQKRISHIGSHTQLEDQMIAFTADFDRAKAGYSPDRVDALVWAMTDLMLGHVINNNIGMPVQVAIGMPS